MQSARARLRIAYHPIMDMSATGFVALVLPDHALQPMFRTLSRPTCALEKFQLCATTTALLPSPRPPGGLRPFRFARYLTTCSSQKL